MGKGTRNRQFRDVQSDVEVVKAAPKKKKARSRKPLSNTAKNIIEYAIVLTLVLAIVAGSLVSAGTFKRANILVYSKTGDWDLNQQQATYFIWTDIYQQSFQNEYYNAYLQNTSGSNLDYSSMMSNAVNTAAGTVQYYLASALNGDEENSGYAEFLKKFVAVLDEATNRGIFLSKEEIKTAKQEAAQTIKDLAASFQSSQKSFLKNAIGCNVKMKDIKSMAVMQALYTKVVESKETELKDALKPENLESYREDHAESFYFTEYLAYTLKDGEDDLKAALEAATTVEEFKAAVAKFVFNDKIETSYNKFNAKESANVLEAALKDKNAENWEETVRDVIDTKKLLTEEEYNNGKITIEKADEEVPSDIIKWIFEEENRKAYNVKQFELKEGDPEEAVGVCVVVLLADPTETSVDAFVMSYEYADVESDDYKAFVEKALNTLLVEFKLVEKTEEMETLEDVETESAEGKILDELKSAIETKFKDAGFRDSSNKDTTKTQYLDKDVTDDDLKTSPYLNWMFGDEAVNGKVKAFEKTETKDGAEVKTTTYYCIVKALDYDKDPLVDGGYLEFKTVAEAEEFYATLSGKTGDDLSAAFTEKSGTVSTSISADNMNEDLKAWLFDSARTAGEVKVITSGEKAYVAFYNDSTPTWEQSAESGYLSEALENWITDLSASYTTNAKALKRIKDKPLETAETTTEA